MWLFSNTKVHSLIYRTCFLFGYTVEVFGFPLQLLGSIFQLAGDGGHVLGLAPHLLVHSHHLFGQDPLLVLQVPRVGFRKVFFASGPLGIFLREVFRLF